ncbi:MAG: T9SS type A sorting domain-containing protein [Saprospiraceae bacterium]
MRKVSLLLLFVLANFISNGQCSSVGVQISSSDTTYIQLYHAGFFLIPSGDENIVQWEVTTFSGDIIHQDNTSGGFNDQSNSYFDHSIPITDSMKATIIITNNTEGIMCTMTDTLYWQVDEILPGAFIGYWNVLSDNGGVEEDISTSSEEIFNVQNIELFPSPAFDHFSLKGDLDVYSFNIIDVNGQILGTYNNIHSQERVDISQYSSGVYFVQFWDQKNKNIGVKKMVKM